MFRGDASCLTGHQRHYQTRIDPDYPETRDESIATSRINSNSRYPFPHPGGITSWESERGVANLGDLEPHTAKLRLSRTSTKHQSQHAGPAPSTHNQASSPQRKIPRSPFTSLNITSANSIAIATSPARMMYSRVRALNALPLMASATLMRI